MRNAFDRLPYANRFYDHIYGSDRRLRDVSESRDERPSPPTSLVGFHRLRTPSPTLSHRSNRSIAMHPPSLARRALVLAPTLARIGSSDGAIRLSLVSPGSWCRARRSSLSVPDGHVQHTTTPTVHHDRSNPHQAPFQPHHDHRRGALAVTDWHCPGDGAADGLLDRRRQRRSGSSSCVEKQQQTCTSTAAALHTLGYAHAPR